MTCFNYVNKYNGKEACSQEIQVPELRKECRVVEETMKEKLEKNV